MSKKSERENWCVSKDGSIFTRVSQFAEPGKFSIRDDTLVGAIEEGKRQYGYEKFFVGRAEEIDPVMYMPDGDDIINILEDRASEDVGEIGCEWLAHVGDKLQDDLRDRVTETILIWMERHRLLPTFFRVVGIEKVDPLAHAMGSRDIFETQTDLPQ